MATELATAYISLVPSFKGGASAISRELGEIVDKAGRHGGQVLGEGLADGLKRDAAGKLRDAKGRFVKEAGHIGDQAGKRAGSGFSSAFGRAGSLVAPVAAGALILGQVKDVFAAAAESRKIAALTEQVIKTTGGAAKLSAEQIGDMAGALAKKTGVDDEVIQSGANLLLTFKNLKDETGEGNDVFTQTLGLANDMSVALGQDMASSSMQLGKALNDPIKGVGALSRVGVSFTEQQKEQIRVLTESGDVLGAQKIILGEVGDQFGGAAAAAATPMDRLKVVVGDLQEKLGEKLLPVVDKVATWLGDHLPGFVDRAGEAFSDLRVRLEPVVGFLSNVLDVGRDLAAFVTDTLIPRVTEAIDGLIGGFTGEDSTGFFGAFGDTARSAYDYVKDVAIPGIQEVIGSFVAGLKGEGGEGSFFTDLGEGAAAAAKVFQDDVLPVIKEVTGFIKDYVKPILIGLATVILLPLAPLILLAGGFIWAYQKSEFFRKVIAKTFDVIKGVIAIAFRFKFILLAIVAPIAAIPLLLVFAYKKFETFRNVVDTVVGFIRDVAMAIFRRLVDFWNDTLLPAITALAGFFMETLWPAVRDAFGFIQGIVQSVWETVLLPIFGFISGFITGVLIPVFMFLKNIIVDIVFPIIVAVIKDAWEIGIKPIFDRLTLFFNEILIPIFNELWGVVAGAFQGVKDAVTGAWEFVEPILQKVIDFVRDKVSPIWDGMVAAAKTAFDLLPGIMAKVLQTVGDMVADLLDLAAQVARKLQLDSIAEQMEKGAEAARKWGDEAKKESTNNTDRGTGGLAVEGGMRRAGGGIIPGTGNRDTVPVMATPGEFYFQKSAVKKWGTRDLARMNAGLSPTGTGGYTIQHLEVTAVANANADEVVGAINAKLGWAHTTRRDR
jgi:hypothetical protein